MGGRLRKADSHRITQFCRALVDRGLQDDRVRYLASGRYSDCFLVTASPDVQVVAKASTYRDGCLRAVARAMQKGDYDKAKAVLQADAVGIGGRVARVTNLMLHNDVTPHLVWAFGDFDCKNFAQAATGTKLGPSMRKRLKQINRENGQLQQLYTNLSFHEKFSQDLTDFVRDSCVTTYCFKCIIAQVVFTVACLQHVMPGFRHNDLSTNNVFVRVREAAPDRYDHYSLGGSSFYTCTPGVLVAVSDWDFAHCQDPFEYGGHQVCLRNERVVSGAYQLKPTRNPSYDTHFFLTTLLQQLRDRARAHGEVVAFLRAVTGKWNDRTDVYLARLEPQALLAHAFFDELRATPPGTVRHRFTPDGQNTSA